MFFPIIMFTAFTLFFVGAVYDIDWIMKMTKADRRYGRSVARIMCGVAGFVGIIVMTIILIQ
jgi:hypothetical protein